jgi:hypothetical protein
MLEKIIVLSIIYMAILANDVPKLKENSKFEYMTYGLLMLISVYLGLDYVLELHWPNLTNLVHALLGRPAKHIFDLLQVKS